MGRPNSDPYLMCNRFEIELPDELMNDKNLTLGMIVGVVTESMRKKLIELKYNPLEDTIEGCTIRRKESGKPYRVEYAITKKSKGEEHAKATRQRKERKNEATGGSLKGKKHSKKKAPEVHG